MAEVDQAETAVNEEKESAEATEVKEDDRLLDLPEKPNTRRRSSRLKTTEVPETEIKTEEAASGASEEVPSEMETSTTICESFINPVGQIKLEISQESESRGLSQEEMFEQLNELFRGIKGELQDINRKLRGKASDLLGINHKAGVSKVSKLSTFKMQQERLKIAKKQKKFSRMIQGMKQGQRQAESEAKSTRQNKKVLVQELNLSLSVETLEASMEYDE